MICILYIYSTFGGDFGYVKSIYRLVLSGDFSKGLEVIEDVEVLRIVFSYVIIFDIIYFRDGVLILSSFSIDWIPTVSKTGINTYFERKMTNFTS